MLKRAILDEKRARKRQAIDTTKSVSTGPQAKGHRLRPFVRIGALVKATGWSEAEIRRMAHAGDVPDVVIRKGKKMKFLRTAKLSQWVDKMRSRETKKGRAMRLKKTRDRRRAAAAYVHDGRRPTGTGYGALIDAERWARKQTQPQETFTAESANAILSDTANLCALLDDLKAISKRALIGHGF